MSPVVGPSGECLRGDGLVWLIGAVAKFIQTATVAAYKPWGGGVLAGCLPRVQLFISSLARAVDGRIGSCRSTAT